MTAEQTHVIEMTLNVLNDIAQSLKTIAENTKPRILLRCSQEPRKDGKADAWNIDRTVYEVLSQVSGSTQEGEMTNEEAIRVLAMVEAHGSLTQKAKERAIKALNQMGRIESLINMDTAGKRSIKLAELKEVIQ